MKAFFGFGHLKSFTLGRAFRCSMVQEFYSCLAFPTCVLQCLQVFAMLNALKSYLEDPVNKVTVFWYQGLSRDAWNPKHLFQGFTHRWSRQLFPSPTHCSQSWILGLEEWLRCTRWNAWSKSGCSHRIQTCTILYCGPRGRTHWLMYWQANRLPRIILVNKHHNPQNRNPPKVKGNPYPELRSPEACREREGHVTNELEICK